jgi:hypothetical protein
LLPFPSISDDSDSGSSQAIALNGSRIDVNQAMQLVARPTDKHPGGASFINGNTMNNVTRSRYGRKAIGNVTRDVPQAKNLTTPTSKFIQSLCLISVF